jgi:hypothetical protein
MRHKPWNNLEQELLAWLDQTQKQVSLPIRVCLGQVQKATIPCSKMLLVQAQIIIVKDK